MYFSLEFQNDIPFTKMGYELVYKIKFSQEDVIKYSEITGDKNPIHTELEYAKIQSLNSQLYMVFLWVVFFLEFLVQNIQVLELSI